MDRRDWWWAGGAGATALAVYVATLAPGLVAEVDTPMFQFVGRILGVPHNPGYPLYVLLTHLISLLPFGSLAYRINLYSAVCGALAVATLFLAARALRCGRPSSLLASLGLAFGRVFWSQAVIAEVYTMHAALIAMALVATLEWGRSRRPGAYYTAIAILAAGLAHHTTIAAFLPAIAAYAVLTDRAFFLRARTLITTSALLACGLVPYLFIVIRSNQPGAYVEAGATRLRDLPDVILAAQFQHRVFAFDWQTVVTVRVPSLVAGVLIPEMTVPGLLLALVGASVLIWRRRAEALLLTVGGGAVFLFALNYSVVDTPVFLIPTMLVLWLLAAVGVERLRQLVSSRSVASTALGLAALVLPAWELAHNYASNDRSRDTGTALALNGLFDALPPRAALVHEDFFVDRLLTFQQLVGGRSGGRVAIADPEAAAVRERLAAGDDVFAFAKSARRLRLDGLDVGFRPLTVASLPLADLLAPVADGSVVVLAAPAAMAAPFAAGAGDAFARIGAPRTLVRSARASLVIVGVAGARSGAVARADAPAIDLDIAPGSRVGATGTTTLTEISIRAGATDVGVRQGGRDLLRTTEGTALAVWDRDGQLTHLLVLPAIDGFRAPPPSGALSVFPVRASASVAVVSGDWVDVTAAVASGSAVVRVPPGQSLLLQVTDARPLALRLVDRPPAIARVAIGPIVESAGAGASSDFSSQIEVAATASESVGVQVAVGGVPRRALARVTSAAGAAILHPVSYDGLLRTPDRVTEVLQMARDEQQQLVGDGWSRVDADPAGPYRVLTASEGRVLLPVAHTDLRQAGIQARWRGHAPASIALVLNGIALPGQPLRAGWQTYVWELPPGFHAARLVDTLIRVGGTAASEPAGEVAVAGIHLTSR